MGTRLVNLVVDAARPRELAAFWAALLGWQVAAESPAEVEVHAPAEDGWELDLIFVPVPVRALPESASPAWQESGPPALVPPPASQVLSARPGSVPPVPAPPSASVPLLAPAPAPARAASAPSSAPAGSVVVPKAAKNRIHLDLASTSPEHQAALVERALGLGARRRDLGQGDVPWVVLADPEGNEFCVLEPRAVYAGSGAVAAIVVDSGEPVRLAGFWSALVGWPVYSAEDVIVGLRAPSGRGPRLEFLRSAEDKVGKNRLHLDVAPATGEDHAAAVAQVIAAGAVRADIGQGDTPWAVLADPEGNEFCVLTPR